ncbi:Cinnamyl alcohol dehydrogenase 2 [Hondaea fermentalgiana]|uniref:Cinnamyl alcohol dehydrogenase 2 n=1 Tax=Hondaea fermentalgiana TaxID=2315210 RepID=A0A2R5GED9_9STRA|nr:Cinnamyl alcohol dehydrogenase 2 [Hondaea fermentalgiana]|eukprot:GBG29292.1 Cinnamyl alcohol dehydrogenase 2 [Hondaea fermentalgiana]
MGKVAALAAPKPGADLEWHEVERREVHDDDVEVEIKYSGICGSDLHQVRSEWGDNSEMFPMCPGHEMVGVVKSVGKNVTKFKEGDLAGVGNFVDSCRECGPCKAGDEHLCNEGFVFTYAGKMKYDHSPCKGEVTQGGYSASIVCNERYVVSIPKNLDLSKVAPVLCAGITVFSPLNHYGLKEGMKFGVAGLGGLGHMAVKFANAMGAKVVVLSRGTKKKDDALELGAHEYLDSTDEDAMKEAAGSFDFILDTISAKHAVADYLPLLVADGKLINVGMAPEPLEVPSMALAFKRLVYAGSLIGGMKELQECLDFCGKHEIHPEVEFISCDKVNEAYKRVDNADVRFRFVMDMSTLKKPEE